MNNEQLANAMYSLRDALNDCQRIGLMDVQSFSRAVETFELSVMRLGRILGMQAENDVRRSQDLSPAYDEKAFLNNG